MSSPTKQQKFCIARRIWVCAWILTAMALDFIIAIHSISMKFIWKPFQILIGGPTNNIVSLWVQEVYAMEQPCYFLWAGPNVLYLFLQQKHNLLVTLSDAYLVALQEKQLEIDQQNDPSRHLVEEMQEARMSAISILENQIAIAYENNDLERVFQLEYNFDHLYMMWFAWYFYLQCWLSSAKSELMRARLNPGFPPLAVLWVAYGVSCMARSPKVIDVTSFVVCIWKVMHKSHARQSKLTVVSVVVFASLLFTFWWNKIPMNNFKGNFEAGWQNVTRSEIVPV